MSEIFLVKSSIWKKSKLILVLFLTLLKINSSRVAIQECSKKYLLEKFGEVSRKHLRWSTISGQLVYNLINTELCKILLTFQNSFQNT